MEQKYRLKNLTPPEMCGIAACPQIYKLEKISSEVCAAMACPAVYQPKEIASEACAAMACPIIFEGESGKDVYIIIGKQLSPTDVGLEGKVGEGETVIEVPKRLLENLGSKK